MAALVGIAPDLCAILASHVAFQLVNCSRPGTTDDIERNGLMRIAAETATGNDSCRVKSRADNHATRGRTVSPTPPSSDGASATAKTRRPKGSKLDADTGSNLNAD